MRVKVNPVPRRRGWHLGHPITTGLETRCAVTHVETGLPLWVWGDTPERRIEEAQRVIDEQYQTRWNAMAELIEVGDFHGPNVALVESHSGYTSTA